MAIRTALFGLTAVTAFSAATVIGLGATTDSANAQNRDRLFERSVDDRRAERRAQRRADRQAAQRRADRQAAQRRADREAAERRIFEARRRTDRGAPNLPDLRRANRRAAERAAALRAERRAAARFAAERARERDRRINRRLRNDQIVIARRGSGVRRPFGVRRIRARGVAVSGRLPISAMRFRARRQAVQNWRRKVRALYGRRFSFWALARNKRVNCTRVGPNRVACRVAAKPRNALRLTRLGF
ncbi:MAG: hypothetical protein AAFR04_13615 [Pseudomonadota bacterium]